MYFLLPPLQSLVSLGACLFSITSTFAFVDGPMAWDSSRVAAAIPSGVGFLGAGLIFKEAQKDKKSAYTSHVVHGLTTATSLWLVSYILLKESIHSTGSIPDSNY
jgi:putative Mg2+ transporter-C (MgtC) family protein